METVAQRCERIIAALEDLAAQEAAGVAAGDFEGVRSLQDRTAPLIDFLAAEGGAALGIPSLRRRLTAVYELRLRSGEALATAMTRVRSELAQTQASQRRAAQVGPAYGQPGSRPPRLDLVG